LLLNLQLYFSYKVQWKLYTTAHYYDFDNTYNNHCKAYVSQNFLQLNGNKKVYSTVTCYSYFSLLIFSFINKLKELGKKCTLYTPIIIIIIIIIMEGLSWTPNCPTWKKNHLFLHTGTKTHKDKIKIIKDKIMVSCTSSTNSNTSYTTVLCVKDSIFLVQTNVNNTALKFVFITTARRIPTYNTITSCAVTFILILCEKNFSWARKNIPG